MYVCIYLQNWQYLIFMFNSKHYLNWKKGYGFFLKTYSVKNSQKNQKTPSITLFSRVDTCSPFHVSMETSTEEKPCPFVITVCN